MLLNAAITIGTMMRLVSYMLLWYVLMNKIIIGGETMSGLLEAVDVSVEENNTEDKKEDILTSMLEELKQSHNNIEPTYKLKSFEYGV